MMYAVTVTLPERLNRQSSASLLQELAKAEKQPLVLMGGEACFCRGLDLAALSSDRGELQIELEGFVECLQRLKYHAAPTLAVVQGEAQGGGVALAAVCDVVLADANARFALPELLYGFIPGIILPFLLDRLSEQAVRRLCVAGEGIDVEVAARMGLVDQWLDSAADDGIKKLQAYWLRNMSRINTVALARLRALCKTRLETPSEQWRQQCVASSLDLLLDEKNRQALKLFLEEGVSPWENAGE